MSVLRKIPYIESKLSALTSEQLETLVSVINSTGGADSFYTLETLRAYCSEARINAIQLELKNGVTKSGFLIYNGTWCLFLAYHRFPDIEQYEINLTDLSIKVIKEDLTVEELRRVLSSVASGGGLTPDTLLNVLEGSDYISVDLNEDESKVVVELDETLIDAEPTEDSDNLVKSGGVYGAIHNLTADEIIADNSQSVQDNLERIDERIDNLGTVYTFKGTCTYSQLPTNALPGDVWNVTDAHGSFPAGTNYAWTGSVWDALGGEIDLSGKLDASKQAVANVGGLVIPSDAPTDTALVAVETDREQSQVYLGTGLELGNSTSPYNMNVVGVADVRTGNEIKIWTGTQAQYDAITTKDADTLYIVKEEQ